MDIFKEGSNLDSYQGLEFPHLQHRCTNDAADGAWRSEGVMGEKQVPCWNFPITHLGGGFKDFLFSSLFGEDSHFD